MRARLAEIAKQGEAAQIDRQRRDADVPVRPAHERPQHAALAARPVLSGKVSADGLETKRQQYRDDVHGGYNEQVLAEDLGSPEPRDAGLRQEYERGAAKPAGVDF